MIQSSKYHHSEEQLEEEQKMIALAQKDTSAFEWLYNKYYEQIFRFVYQRLDDKDVAFDITSQVFLNAMSALGNYQYKGVPFASWLYKIALNELHKAFRKDASLRTINIESDRLAELFETHEEDILGEYLPALKKAMALLPLQESELIELRFFQQLSFKEIAEITDTTEANAKMRLYRVLEKLKKQLMSLTHQIA